MLYYISLLVFKTCLSKTFLTNTTINKKYRIGTRADTREEGAIGAIVPPVQKKWYQIFHL